MPSTSNSIPSAADGAEFRSRARSVLEAAWVDEGYASPNHATYPYQWLWDSCFHAIAWADVGRPDRAVEELQTALSVQAPDGFVPHMNYVRRPGAHADLWRRDHASSITQPPMYGHAVAELHRRGVAVAPELVDRCRNGLRFLLFERPRHRSGLVTLCHPWESGADDSPRWDGAIGHEAWTRERWRVHKSWLVSQIEESACGSPLTNRAFDVASVGFSALVAFNATEIAETFGDDELAAAAAEIGSAVASRWDPALRTWVDAGVTEAGSGRVRTIDGALGVLVTAVPGQRDQVVADLVDDTAFGGPFGPAGVHRAEPCFDPRSYWRGPTWPQMAYLMWVAARRWGHLDVAAQLGRQLVDGADRSGFSEYWDPDDATGGGACPQTWATIAVAALD